MKPVGVTLGDPAGIGPEIVAKVLSDLEFSERYPFIPIGPEHILTNAFEHILKFDAPNYSIIPVDFEDRSVEYGVNKASYGELSMRQIRAAVEKTLAGELAAVVTAPINKRSVSLAGYEFTGHTEYLGHLTKCDNFSMMLVSPRYRVLTVTTHLPVREVADALSTDKILKGIVNAHSAGALFGLKNPRIAVCALNPHAGDGGSIGSEEGRIIAPAIEKAREKGINAQGPYPADALFARPKRFDIAVSMYHDQGLIPIKMDSHNRGVNLTLGLPIVRASVDHGTAFDIAGKGIANEGSLKEAIMTAYHIARIREIPLAGGSTES